MAGDELAVAVRILYVNSLYELALGHTGNALHLRLWCLVWKHDAAPSAGAVVLSVGTGISVGDGGVDDAW